MTKQSKSTTPESLVRFDSWLADDDKLRELGRHRLARAIRAALEDRLGLPGTDPHVVVAWDSNEALPKLLSQPSEVSNVTPQKWWVNLEIWNKESDPKSIQKRTLSEQEVRERAEEVLTPEERAVVDKLGGLDAVLALDF